ncbi:MAG TPA: DUF4129 domain-containing protein [Candidatus Angelobacter sp.]|nr:DUF4129 domain-containing protein [Candidatus Angelobacter sp.]
MSSRRGAAALLGGLAALLVVAIHGVNVQAQAPAPGVEFVAALQDAYSALPPADTAPGNDPRLDRVRAPLLLAESLAPGSVALAPIDADLARDPADIADVRLRLRTLIDALALPPGSVAADPQAAQSALRDVYAQDAFHNVGATPSNDSIFSRIGSAFLNAVHWLADHTVGALGLVPTIVIACLLIAAIVGFVLLRLRSVGTRTPRGRALAEPAPQGLDAEAEWRRAEEAAARGEHREAVRHAFRSALLAAAQRGRLRVDASWTTSELLARARGDADLVALLAPAAASFDHAWYSGRPVSAPDWEVARERCSAVRRIAARRGVTA